MIAYKLVDLESKGYSLEQSQAAVKRARKWAQSIANKIKDERVRQEAFVGLFSQGMEECEPWLNKVKNSKENWIKGLNDLGAPVGPQTTAAYDSWTK